MRSSVPVLQLRPQFLQRLLEPSAIEHVEMLVRHRIWVAHARDLLHAYKQSLEALLAIIHDDRTLAGVISRSPQEIALVTADRLVTVFENGKVLVSYDVESIRERTEILIGVPQGAA